MESQTPQLLIVADDGNLHPAINRGIEYAASNSLITHADFMTQPSLVTAIRKLYITQNNVHTGLHVSVFGTHDSFAVTAFAYFCRMRPGSTFQRLILNSTKKQIDEYQEAFLRLPSHLSTHGDLHLNTHGEVFPWYRKFMQELDRGNEIIVRGMQTQPIRLIRARSALLGKRPVTPQEFIELLSRRHTQDVTRTIELVVHPASIRSRGEPPLISFYPLALRVADLQALISIMNSEVIEDAGFKVWTPINSDP